MNLKISKPILISIILIIIIMAVTMTYMNKDKGGKLDKSDIHKIKHIIFIMQENRAFDHYFGTFPGAEGIPMRNGIPTVCIMIRIPHNTSAAIADINKGKMDGFIKQR